MPSEMPNSMASSASSSYSLSGSLLSAYFPRGEMERRLSAVVSASSDCSTPRRSGNGSVDLWETAAFFRRAGGGVTSWRDKMKLGGDGRRRAMTDEFDVAGGGVNKSTGGSYNLSGNSSVTSLMMMALEGGGVHSLSHKPSCVGGRISRSSVRIDLDTQSIFSEVSSVQPFMPVADAAEEAFEQVGCYWEGGGGSDDTTKSSTATSLSRMSRMKSVCFSDELRQSVAGTVGEKKRPDYDSSSSRCSDDAELGRLCTLPSIPGSMTSQSAASYTPRVTTLTANNRWISRGSSVESGGQPGDFEDDLVAVMSVDSMVNLSEYEEAEEDRLRRMLWRRKREGGQSFGSVRSRGNSSRVLWRWSEPTDSRGRRIMGPELHGGDIVLVTGATSFLGCHLVMALLDRGVCVRAVTRRLLSCPKSSPFSARHRDSLEVTEGGEWLMRLHPNAGRQLQVVEGDVYGGEEEWRQLFDGCRYMVWACSRTWPTAVNDKRRGGTGLETTGEESENEVDEVPTEGSADGSVKAAHNVFGWGAKYGVTRAVIMSTISEYSRGAVRQPGKPTPEDESDKRQETCPRSSSQEEAPTSVSIVDHLLYDVATQVDDDKSGDASVEGEEKRRGGVKLLVDATTNLSERTAENAVFQQQTLTEMAAWDVARKYTSMELVSVCSGWVFGSVLLQRHCKCMSLQVIEGLLLGRWPRLPVYGYPPVDVRDVAVAGVLGLILPTEQVAGQRLLVGAHETISLSQVGCILKIEFGEFGFEPNTSETTTSSMVVAETMEASSDADGTLISPQGGSGSECSSLSSGKSLINPCNEEMSRTRTDLWWYWNHERFGRLVKVDLSWSKSVLGIEYRPVAKAIVDSVMSMMALRILPQRRVPDDLIEFALFYQMGYRLSDRQRQRCSYSQRGSIDVPTLILQQGLRETTSERIEGGEEAVRQGFVRGPLGTRLRQKVMTRGGEDVIWARDTNCRDSGRNNCLWPQVTDDLFF
eukprot:GHVS01036178.1.p1 GENE.GHVS01036178.1~~GHVS01036178.1.p1  ORF type:complete len:982 (-),score=168.84 GHVS01036178.1:1718-4663(-)